mgnify:CR=1 FL=1
MIFIWKPETRLPKRINPQMVGDRVEYLRSKRKGIIHPEDLVEDAKAGNVGPRN